MSRAYLGLGSNLEPRREYLARAVEALGRYPGIAVLRRSSLYETEPVGPVEQGWFLNGVVEVETSLSPAGLLAACKRIEKRLGRKPGIRWGPRPVDLDILLFDRLVLQEDNLVIPHPLLRQRAFVLVPLAELEPGLELPGGGTVGEALSRLHDPHQVRRYNGGWP